MASSTKTRSPLKEPPLRQAGQSLDQQLQRLADNKLLPWMLIPGLLIVLAMTEWIRFLSGSEPMPWLFTVIAVVGTGIAIEVIRRTIIEARYLRLGRDGERVVGDSLQALVANGWQVFHDVPGNDFNIDHVVIGPGGIFTIETKTRSKPEGKRARIVVNRQGISVAGGPASPDALDQASAQSNWLADFLRKSTSRSFRVRPVVLFPNWWIEQKCPRKSSDPWVLEPKGFLKWLQRERRTLTDEQIALASTHLGLYIKRHNES